MELHVSSSRLLGLSLLWGILLGGSVAAQEPPPDETEPAAPSPAADARPAELARIQEELARLRSERKRLIGGEEETREDIELTPDELSPVLAPRSEVVGLTLSTTIAEALENNPDYIIQILAARATREGVPQQVAVFDPTLSFTGSWTEPRSAYHSNNPYSPYPVGQYKVIASEALSCKTVFSKQFALGTSVSLTWNESRAKSKTSFDLNPSYSPYLALEVSQPLLKGFGIEANTAGIHIAQNDALSSDAQAASIYMAAVLAIEDAYWNLVRTEEILRFQERSLSSALQFHEDQRKREEHGAGTRLEVTIARAGVAQRREGVIVAENALEAARDQIVRLTRPSSDPDKWNLFIVPLDRPRLIAEPQEQVAAVIQTALQRRPDYWQAQLAIDSARKNLTLAENQALPSLAFFSRWQQDGLGGQHHSAWSSITRGRFYTWTAGVQVELPLFLRSERARARQARLQLEQAEVSLRSLEATIVLDVRKAIRNIRTAKAQIEATTSSRQLARERLDATREMLRAGTAVPRDVLDDLAGLAQAESAEIQAYINYRLSISSLKLTQGILLDDWLDRIPPRLRDALDRRPFN